MIKYTLALLIAFGAMLGISAQAAPAAPAFMQAQIAPDSAVQKVWHCRYWSGGWGCGGGYRWHRWHRWHRHW